MEIATCIPHNCNALSIGRERITWCASKLSNSRALEQTKLTNRHKGDNSSSLGLARDQKPRLETTVSNKREQSHPTLRTKAKVLFNVLHISGSQPLKYKNYSKSDIEIRKLHWEPRRHKKFANCYMAGIFPQQQGLLLATSRSHGI